MMTVSLHQPRRQYRHAGPGLWVQASRTIIFALLLAGFHKPAFSDAIAEIEWFKSTTAREAARVRELPEARRAGCDIETLLAGPVITRSREPQLKAGDRLLAINSQSVSDAPDAPFRQLNALSPDAVAHLKIERNGAISNVDVPCKDAASEVQSRLTVLDAAAKGTFVKCSDAAAEYTNRFIQSSGMYGLWRLCEIYADHLTDDQHWSTLLTFWTLHLQELKYRPEAIDTERAKFLTALTNMMNAQQPLLAAEMRRQWNLATGESLEAPNLAPQATPKVSHPVTAPAIPLTRLSLSSCESGHWVEEVMSHGAIIKLEDGSLWQIDDSDTVVSAVWVPTTDTVVCNGKLINTENNESVEARRINN